VKGEDETKKGNIASMFFDDDVTQQLFQIQAASSRTS